MRDATLTEKMRLDKDGNLGIGTTNPLQRFQINDGAQSIVGTSTGSVGIGTTSPSQALDVRGTGRLSNLQLTNLSSGTAPNVLTLNANNEVETRDTTNWDTNAADDISISGTDNRLARFNAAGDNVENG